MAIACSDIHLSAQCPKARRAEPDWFEAMLRSLRFLAKVQARFDVPILCAGDVFHTWNAPASIINFAIRHLPKMYAVPGQHDLPYHVYDKVKESAYWTLVEAGTLEHVEYEQPIEVNGMRLHGFAWDKPLYRLRDENDVALVHSFIWDGSDRTGFVGASRKTVVNRYVKQLGKGTCALFGDNHIGFKPRGTRFVNCGTFFARNVNEQSYLPSIWLLRYDGQHERVALPTSQDKWSDPDGVIEKEHSVEMRLLLRQLKRMDVSSFDTEAKVRGLLESDGLSKSGKTILRKALQSHGNG